jgi:integrase
LVPFLSAFRQWTWLGIGCFGGVRPEESARMTWEMVDFKRKHIDLPAEITKAGERRIVDMPDNLVEWLLPSRKESGPLLPVNFRVNAGHSAER